MRGIGEQECLNVDNDLWFWLGGSALGLIIGGVGYGDG